MFINYSKNLTVKYKTKANKDSTRMQEKREYINGI